MLLYVGFQSSQLIVSLFCNHNESKQLSYSTLQVTKNVWAYLIPVNSHKEKSSNAKKLIASRTEEPR